MKKIVVVSDTHAGSSYGLLPPKAYSPDGPVGQNDGQKYLWDCWSDACEKIAKLKPDYLIHLGDSVDGDQRKEGGRKLQSILGATQVDWAKDVLSKLPRVPTYFIHGTPYHDGRSGEYTEFLASSLGGVQPPRGTHLAGEHSFHYLNLNVEDVILNFLHEIPGGVGFYRGTAMDREMLWSALAGKVGRAIAADHVHRAHLHFFVHIEHASKHGVINPCWQLASSYSMRKSAYRMLPDIGFTVLHVDGAAKKARRDPIFVEKFLYDLPTAKAVLAAK